MSRLTAAVLLAAGMCPLPGADPEPHWVALNHAARQAEQAKDYARLSQTLAELLALLPGNADIRYKIAVANAKQGHSARALAELGELAAAGLVYDLANDQNFGSLRGSPGFSAVLRRVELNRKPAGHSVGVQALPEPDLMPEDLAYDPQTQRFFVASVAKAKIVTADGHLFANTDYAVLALRIDPARRILWAATGWVPHCVPCKPVDKNKSALLAFQLDSGALIERIDSPVKGLLGDMTISRAGDLYVSEGIYGAVLCLPANAHQLTRLDPPGEFPSPQTPALSADEHILYIPDYVRGIAAMDLKSRVVRWLQPAPQIVLNGVDGFYRYGDAFLAVQNGIAPERLVLFSADLTRQRILEANTPGLGSPTHGTFLDQTFYFIANTGWDAYDDDGKRKPGTLPVKSELRKLDLSDEAARF
jgi:hypothetical protein